MKRRSKNFLAFFVAAFFTFCVLCATLGAPGQALASMSGCSQTADAMVMADCEQPAYFCGLDFATRALSRATLSSAQSNDCFKNALGLAFDVPSVYAVIGLAPPGARQWKNVSLAQSGKVSIRLFISILNL
jgi:hypothetical protein